MFRKVVVALDLTPEAERAIPYGAGLAGQAGAELELLTVQPTDLATTTIRDRLADVAVRHGVEAGLRVLAADHITDALVGVADTTGALLCLQTSARRPLGELLLGSVSERVVRAAHHPLLLVGPRCGPSPDRFDSMTVGLDGSELAEQILPVVVDWSSRLDIAPWLFEVLAAHAPLETAGDDIHETAYVHRVADRLAEQGVKADWDVSHDRNPAAAIARFAGVRAASLIALTTHGRSGLKRFALGSVALQVAHNATVPVLVLRPAVD